MVRSTSVGARGTQLRLLGVSVVAILACLVAAAPVAATVYSGTTYATNNNAKSTWRVDTYTSKRSGTLYDLNAGNAKCARVYDRGYNIFAGWSGWNLRKTVCAGGHASWSFTPAFYADHTEIKVCDGYSYCRVKRII
jgi:hypothetical protein